MRQNLNLCSAVMLAGLLSCSPALAQTVGGSCSNTNGSLETTKSSTDAQGIVVCAPNMNGDGAAWEPIGQGLPSYDQSGNCANVGQFRYNTSTKAPQYCNASGVWTAIGSSSEFQPSKSAGTGSSFCTAATDASANPYIYEGGHTWPGTIYFYQDSHHAVLCNLTGAGLSVMDQYGTSELYPWH